MHASAFVNRNGEMPTRNSDTWVASTAASSCGVTRLVKPWNIRPDSCQVIRAM
jgi:hypothetical protein